MVLAHVIRFNTRIVHHRCGLRVLVEKNFRKIGFDELVVNHVFPITS
jgi:hypothetical protein